MKSFICLIFSLLTSTFAHFLSAQTLQDRPKIIIGVVVDQMRWDYLYRYQDRYTNGGFKRLLLQGFSFDNTHIPYNPTATGPGHASVFTGSVPAIHGIISNHWYDRKSGKGMNCVGDSTVLLIGTEEGALCSPDNLLVTTIGDELKLSNNMRSKVIGVALKDRAAILPAGHLSDGSYWYDFKTGKFITSNYYIDDLPKWVVNFNNLRLPDKYLSQTWETLYPLDSYHQSTKDYVEFEGEMIGKDRAIFPYDYEKMENDYEILASTPYGNSITFEIAKAAIEGEDLGKSEFTDMLTISFSATDGLGHRVGPNSIEMEDMYLRLDQEFELFFKYLDERFGENEYLFFITADHGVSQSPGYLKKYNLPTGIGDYNAVSSIQEFGSEKYGISNILLAGTYLNWDEIRTHHRNIDESKLMKEIADIVRAEKNVVDAWPNRDLSKAPWPERIKKMFINGYNAERSGDISTIIRPGWKGSEKGATHGSWYPFDSHIPLVWMGWGIPHGNSNRYVMMTDIAPTLAALLKIQMPSGNIGDPIIEITDHGISRQN